MTLKVKSKHDVDEPLDAFEEVEEVIEEIDDGEGDQTTAHHDNDVQIISEKVVSRIERYFLYANATVKNSYIFQYGIRVYWYLMSLMESLQENINEPEKVPIGIGKEKDVEEKGEKEKNLEKYMEYVPDKREQEVRLLNMLKDQEKEEEVVINILDALESLCFIFFT